MYGGAISVNVKFHCLRVKTSKTLINKGMDVEIDTVLQLVIYGCALCFAHEDRQKLMSAFLEKPKRSKEDKYRI
jgi:hypothetical protein